VTRFSEEYETEVEMTEHLSTKTLERFHQHALTTMDRSLIYDHVLSCEECRKQIVSPEIEVVALETLSADLLSEKVEEALHLDYETIESYVDGTLDTSGRNQIAAHLNVCSTCSAEVSDLRESLAAMTDTAAIGGKNRVSLRQKLQGFVRPPFLQSPLRISIAVAFMILLAITVAVVWRLTSTDPAAVSNKELTADTNPTPTQSPVTVQSSSSPSPTPAASPSPATPFTSPTEPGRQILALNDGPNKIVLERSGKLRGVEALPVGTQRAVREVLLANNITKPEVLNELSVPSVSQRAPAGDLEAATVIYPVQTVITDQTPTLQWSPAKGATTYRVEIGDANFRQVAKSEDLPRTVHSWKFSTPLRRGGIYTWTVRAIDGDGDSLTSQAKFKILPDEKINELAQLRVTRSHLGLGIFYAREGMLEEAERELQIFQKENPGTTLPAHLLQQIKSWQRR
jgi:hypothetical protein